MRNFSKIGNPMIFFPKTQNNLWKKWFSRNVMRIKNLFLNVLDKIVLIFNIRISADKQWRMMNNKNDEWRRTSKNNERKNEKRRTPLRKQWKAMNDSMQIPNDGKQLNTINEKRRNVITDDFERQTTKREKQTMTAKKEPRTTNDI
jgi:hypothetical protein